MSADDRRDSLGRLIAARAARNAQKSLAEKWRRALDFDRCYPITRGVGVTARLLWLANLK